MLDIHTQLISWRVYEDIILQGLSKYMNILKNRTYLCPPLTINFENIGATHDYVAQTIHLSVSIRVWHFCLKFGYRYENEDTHVRNICIQHFHLSLSNIGSWYNKYKGLNKRQMFMASKSFPPIIWKSWKKKLIYPC